MFFKKGAVVDKVGLVAIEGGDNYSTKESTDAMEHEDSQNLKP